MPKHPNILDFLIWEDDDFFLINKPPGITVTQSRADHDGTDILSMARLRYPDAQVCHRIDRETSGVLAIAKHPEAYRHMALAFEHRQVVKVYHAFVNGTPNFVDVDASFPLHVANSGNVTIDATQGKPTYTLFNTLVSYKNSALVECRPVTGKKHQIRIHLSALGYPIVSDSLYGGKPILLSQIKRKYRPSLDREEPAIIARVALHAFRLSFENLRGESVTVEAEYPKDLRLLRDRLDEYASIS